MVKIIYLLVLFSSLSLNAEINKNLNNYLSPANISLDKEAMIYSVSASFNSMSLKSIKIDKPNNYHLSKYHTISKKDKYALKALNKDGKEVFLVGIGNPFYIHVDHIGYEDSEFFGGYIEQEFEIAIPINREISHLILLSQDEFGLKEIKKIEVN
jgi:hypothetical protein